MSRKLASIQQITKIQPIEGADRVVLATILGYECVIRKDDFKVGDFVIYIESDSLLPSDNPAFVNFDKCNYRIKIQKIRNHYSMGLCMPLNLLPTPPETSHESHYKIGQDVTDILNIKLYEPKIPTQLRGIAKGGFPWFIPKTDVLRIQNIPDILPQYHNTLMIATEKLDGASTTTYIKDGTFGVCSRNLELIETPANTIWQCVRAQKFEEILRSTGRNLAFQGEIIGPGIMKNKYHQLTHSIHLFDIYDIDTSTYFSYSDFTAFCYTHSINQVPLVRKFAFHHSIPQLLTMAGGYSLIYTLQQREGIVIKPLIETIDSQIGRVQFKAIDLGNLLIS